MRFLRVFFPQLVAVVLATGSGMAAAALEGAGHPILMVPACVAAALSAIGAIVTFVIKSSDIDGESDWERLDWKKRRGCQKCAALAKDRDELREALATLDVRRLP